MRYFPVEITALSLFSKYLKHASSPGKWSQICIHSWEAPLLSLAFRVMSIICCLTVGSRPSSWGCKRKRLSRYMGEFLGTRKLTHCHTITCKHSQQSPDMGQSTHASKQSPAGVPRLMTISSQPYPLFAPFYGDKQPQTSTGASQISP